MTGGRKDLVPYEEVRKRLRAVESSERYLEEIPIDHIVGSVGRYNDFTSEFLPRGSTDRDRWVGVKLAMTSMEGVPPIEAYRIGDVYFVRDGHHRVSVARELGSKSIQGYVTPVRTRVAYEASDDPESLILKSGYTTFLERTRLDEVRPESDLQVTEAGSYAQLLEHISVHRYYMGIDEDREVGYQEAVEHWFDTVYTPVVEAIRLSGVLQEFPGRTEADLYLWLAEHRARLQDELGWDLPQEQVAQGVAGTPVVDEASAGRVLERIGRAEGVPTRRLSDDLLVAFDLGEPGMQALEQTLILAKREQARVYGLRVLWGDEEPGEKARTREAFDAACEAAGVQGQLAFEEGDPVQRIVQRARWADVVICTLAYPGGEGEPATLAKNVRGLMRRSPRPLLALTGSVSDLQRPLLAYDGGPRARIALFATAYMAVAWGVHPVVVSVAELGQDAQGALDDARTRLEAYGVTADYVRAEGPVPQALLDTCEARGCDVIVMGSYGTYRWLEAMLGGVLEQVLERTPVPVMIT